MEHAMPLVRRSAQPDSVSDIEGIGGAGSDTASDLVTLSSQHSGIDGLKNRVR